VFLAIITLIAANAKASVTPDAECEVQRDDAYQCAKKYGDLDGDGRLSKHEVVYFRKYALRWYEKVLVWAINETPEKIMDRCGAEPDKAYITPESYATHTYKCLRHCKDWRLLMKMCDRIEDLGVHEREAYFGGYQHWRHTHHHV
jgi:hypothetical protein